MDIQNVPQRQDTLGAARQTKGSPLGDSQFSGTLEQVDDQSAEGKGSEEKASASVEAEPELTDQQKLREERLQRFGSYTAYSLWRKTPAMALGIVEPKSEEYFAEHGLLEYWRTEKAHWQGKVAQMSEEERDATGTSLLDEPVAPGAAVQEAALIGGEASDAITEPPSEAITESELKAKPATEPVEATKIEALKVVPEPVPQPAVATTPSVAAVVEHSAPVESVRETNQNQPLASATEVEPVKHETTPANEADLSPEQPEPAVPAVVAPPPVAAAQSVQEPKTQAEIRAERLERFGSYTAYSLWRKIPAMALGIVEPKSEDYMAEHGLLEYWYTERDHWQGKVAAMTEEEREVTGTSLLEPPAVDQTQSSAETMNAAPAGDEAAAGSQPTTADSASQTDVEVAATSAPVSATVAASKVLSTGPSDTTDAVSEALPKPPESTDEPVTPVLSEAMVGGETAESAVQASTSPVVQEIQQAKTQEQLRQERLERFGSYTAYSLWRKIPAMALGIVEPKSEAYFAEHGLLDYWQTEKKHWQEQVAAMSLSERAETGTSLLDEI